MASGARDGWQFWIDVGGTFTDCLALPPDVGQAAPLRHKVLSSGVTKGRIDNLSATGTLQDTLRRGDPEHFWRGYNIRLLDREGGITAETTVEAFDAARGALRLVGAGDLAPRLERGQAYELWSGEEAPVLAMRYILGLTLDQPVPLVAIRLGTTRGTNALITRRGARTAFITTRGFADILRIGYQNRPRLFDLVIRKPESLCASVLEIDERIAADGAVLRAPDADRVREQLVTLRRERIESLAICLLHAYRNSEHEELVERVAREVGFTEISRSSRVAPLIKIVARGDTTVMDAYLNPVLRGYVESLRRPLDQAAGSRLRLLTSAGGLVDPERFVGKDSILSGPAGGVVGYSRIAQAAGFSRSIGFDMGGTSTDVSRFDGRYELQYETEKSGVRIVAPMMAIETVAAGGGSVCHFDGVKLAVGPDSAGAHPGPACYGRGGPLAVTDLNFYLGRLLPEFFPFPLDLAAVEQRLQRLCGALLEAGAASYTPTALAEGFLDIANSNMAKAIRSISVAKGYDPADYVMVAFGGAAPQHACAVAKQLNVRQIIIHPHASVLSAYGIGMADSVANRVQGLYQPYSEEGVRQLANRFQELTEEALQEIRSEGITESSRIVSRRFLDLRYQGLDAWLTIEEPQEEGRTYAAAYEAEHRRLYGYSHKNRDVEIVAARVEVTGRSRSAPQPSTRAPASIPVESAEAREVSFGGKRHRSGVFRRADLRPGNRFAGPALVVDGTSTTVVEPGWAVEVLTQGELLLSDDQGQAAPAISTAADPVQLEIFNNQFAGIAEQMGITLRNTASSVNVKERLDFSCAIFTPRGDLVVNAPHIPVHLGAMSETVKHVLADNPTVAPGDVFVTNDPYRGGSHLPDITVISPVHAAHGDLLFLTASRAHHAEIGGITPGSMPPFSRNLAEEGVVIRNFRLVAAGEPRWDELRELLLSGPYPTRSIRDNLADLAAQVAANSQGTRDLLQLVERYGLSVVQAYMGHIQSAAEEKMKAALRRIEDGTYHFTDHLDDGSRLVVTITITGETVRFDFTGTGGVLPGNLNANRAIVTAAVMYCLRCLIAEEIPLNEGVLAPVTLVLPECLLNPPARAQPEQCAAVVGGNVETSQRVVDVILGALKLAAASQGTMNNLMFGDSTFGYYETICGGAGATSQADGADAVHTHMTNTRLTDPEVLEQRYPVRIREFSIRRRSGGPGTRRGGNGVRRVVEFLRPLQVSLLTQRRGPYAPYGIDGGEPGQFGKNQLQRTDGSLEQLLAATQFSANAGDVLIIETPGGGGWGGCDKVTGDKVTR